MSRFLTADDAALAKSEETAQSWLDSLHDWDRYIAIRDFILRYREGEGIQLKGMGGSGNINYRLIYKDGSSVVLRLPIPGFTQFPDEKVQGEVAVMQWLKENTSIPVPTIIHWGTSEQNPLQLGPFILMEYIDHQTSLLEVLNTPGLTKEDLPALNRNLPAEKLAFFYRQIADALLRLAMTPMSSIGSLVPKTNGSDDKAWEIGARPLSVHWEELVRSAVLPVAELPTNTFATSSSYLNALADLHIRHLVHQPNGAISSKDDCRQKFLARLLFRKLAREDRLLPPSNAGFRLWCDDIKPGNILLDDDENITGVIDWEFSYAAPAEFTYVPPWWLVLGKPHRWQEGLDDWTRSYEKHLERFLQVLQECEDEWIRLSRLDEGQRLSTRMKDSWETGKFWVVYAATHSFGFDLIFRERLDKIFFGPESNWETDWGRRIQLLSDEEQSEFDRLVKEKLESTGLS
ncbi:phosphotransferase family protein [Aspergillus ibericus CBS 121593]|uniref:Phosphotransferase family protein n=1 Tax=Aspergillus ibericus CBS 121593 TaxID=1448316 RepID=A0A395H0T1_9EURO|nr:phosphotransferase family protein [Aspergillus ibericus CBS 121593]RAL01437.1 phosphotransferase family protein [Aspergillus ibericus CBS 121593]